LDSYLNVAGAVGKRIGSTVPIINRCRFGRLLSFVDTWLTTNLIPFSPDVDLSFQNWLEGTNYSEGRKKQLSLAHEEIERAGFSMKDKFVLWANSFIKAEASEEYKYPRGIYSRSDRWKTYVGPFFKNIENVLFSRPEFIKKVPVDVRPQYMCEVLSEALGDVGDTSTNAYRVYNSDYSSFEKHFTKLVYQIELKLYSYMYRNSSQGMKIYDDVARVLCGKNTCIFRCAKVKLPATRLSGEMNTSLGNGFANLMVFKYLMHEKGVSSDRCFVEGDDLLATYFGPKLTIDDYAQLGFTIKPMYYHHIGEASFCGQLFAPTKQILINPKRALLNFGWISSIYLNASEKKLQALARAKAMSYLSLAPACPVVASFCRYILRTTGPDVLVDASLTTYERERRDDLIRSGLWQILVPTNWDTRIMFSEKFGVSIDTQFLLESFFECRKVFAPVEHPALAFCFGTDNVHCYNNYVGVDTGTVATSYKSTVGAHLKVLLSAIKNALKEERHAQEGAETLRPQGQ